MGFFHKKRRDRTAERLEFEIRAIDEYYSNLIPTLDYTAQIELALEVCRNSVSCSSLLKFVHDIELQLLEREHAMLLDAKNAMKG